MERQLIFVLTDGLEWRTEFMGVKHNKYNKNISDAPIATIK